MKAKIISQKVCDGAMGLNYGQFFNVTWVLIPEANNLAITPHQNNLFVRDGFLAEKDCMVLREVDVPDDLVKKAIEFMKLRNELRPKFEEIALGS